MACGVCIDICTGQAREIIGKKVTADEVWKEIEKDIIFYQESGGGATFSGGEPMLQLDFLSQLLSYCRKADIHTVVDTCGYVPWSYFESIENMVDLWLYDTKLIDETKHQKYTGVSNQLILENLRKLARKTKQIEIRIPVIPDINDSFDNIGQIAELVHSLKIRKVSLLPFHKMGLEKYSRLDIEAKIKDVQILSAGHINKLRLIFQEKNIHVAIGGIE